MNNGDKGLVNHYQVSGFWVHRWFLLAVLVCVLMVTHGVSYLAGRVQGYDSGYAIAIHQVSAALKEQIGQGRTFRLKDISIKFHPRKGEAQDINYQIAGAGADVLVRDR